MGRGTRGHVALPRGQARAPAWHGGDTWMLFIFSVYIVYIIYIGLPIIGRHFINPLYIIHIIYLSIPLHFFRVGLKFGSFP